jgi:hypothetical protein
VEVLKPLTSTGDTAMVDRFGWPVDDLLVAPVFDFADGDPVAGGVLTPFVGPALTETGAPVAGLPTPWTMYNGTAPTATSFAANENYRTAVALDPGATDDIVILVLCRQSQLAGFCGILGTRTANVGWSVYTSLGTTFFRSDDGPTNIASSYASQPRCWELIGVTYEDGANQRIWASGTLMDTDNVAAQGSLASGLGFGINCQPNGAADLPSDIARGLVFYGSGLAGIAGDAWHQNAAEVILGSLATQGANGAFARTTSASWQSSGGFWHLADRNMERSGDSGGLRLAPQRVNQALRNFDPQAGDAAAILTITGGAVSEQNDAAALLAAGAREWGPSVYEWTNATGVNQYCRMSVQTGDVNARSLQCLIRRTAGAGAVNLGLYNEVGGAFVAGAAINDGYGTRTLVHGQVPAAATCTLCLEMATGTTVRFVAMGIETGPRATTPIPNESNAVAQTRNADVLTTSDTPGDVEGGFGFDAEPLGWSAAETGGASVLGRAGGGNAMLYVTAAGVWELDLDGTTLVTSTVGPTDGASQRLEVRWSTGGVMTLTIDGVQWSAAYDGSVQNAGAWEFELDGGEMAIWDFVTYRNGSG